MIVDENNNILDYDELSKIVYDVLQPKMNYLKIFYNSKFRKSKGTGTYRDEPINDKKLCVNINIEEGRTATITYFEFQENDACKVVHFIDDAYFIPKHILEKARLKLNRENKLKRILYE